MTAALRKPQRHSAAARRQPFCTCPSTFDEMKRSIKKLVDVAPPPGDEAAVALDRRSNLLDGAELRAAAVSVWQQSGVPRCGGQCVMVFVPIGRIRYAPLPAALHLLFISARTCATSVTVVPLVPPFRSLPYHTGPSKIVLKMLSYTRSLVSMLAIYTTFTLALPQDLAGKPIGGPKLTGCDISKAVLPLPATAASAGMSVPAGVKPAFIALGRGTQVCFITPAFPPSSFDIALTLPLRHRTILANQAYMQTILRQRSFTMPRAVGLGHSVR